MTPTRRIIRARMADLAAAFPPPKRLLEIGIAGDDPPGANREFFKPVDVYVTADKDATLKPDIVLDLESDGSFGEHDHQYDMVLCSQVLEHVWNLPLAAQSLWRLTAWGGLAIVDIPFLYPPHDKEQDYWRMTPVGLGRLLTLAGFGHVETWSDPSYLAVSAVARKAFSA